MLASTQGSGRRQRSVRLLIVGAGLAAGAVLVAAFQWAYYGSPTANGYGRMATCSRFVIGDQRGAVQRAGCSRRTRGSSSWRLWWRRVDLRDLPCRRRACSGCRAHVRLLRLYLPFDNWTYLRFLLPAFPVLMLWAAIGMRQVVGYLREPMPSYAFALTVAWCALAGIHEARVRNVFANAASVERFRSISLEVAKIIPPRSVVVTREFSGSLQYYAHVDTLRWDWLDASGLEQAVSDASVTGATGLRAARSPE